MQLPKKISPDSIRDSLVEFKYSSSLPFEVIVGIFFQALDESYTYTNRPTNILQSLQRMNVGREGFNEMPYSHFVFYSDKIKINVKPNSFVFNCSDKYLGWDLYKNEIHKVLNQISKTTIVENFVRVGLRYVTEYPNTDLQNCVDFKFSFGMTHVKSDKYTFRSEFKLDDYKVILNLSSKVLIASEYPQAPTNTNPSSLVDIDVISEGWEEKDTVSLLNRLDKVHLKEKEVFFNLLNKDFLTSLQPEY